MPRQTITNYTPSQLATMITPATGTDLEALPWILFYTDTASFANSDTNVNAAFFQTVQSDKTLSNIEAAGQLPIPQVFEVAGNTCDILATTQSAATTMGPITDMQSILKTSRGIFTFTLSSKGYGTFPLTAAHATGGEIGYMIGTLGSTDTQSYANNGIFDGGWWVDGAIIIPSQQQYQITIQTSSTALVLVQTPMPVRFGIWGALHRRVL